MTIRIIDSASHKSMAFNEIEFEVKKYVNFRWQAGWTNILNARNFLWIQEPNGKLQMSSAWRLSLLHIDSWANVATAAPFKLRFSLKFLQLSRGTPSSAESLKKACPKLRDPTGLPPATGGGSEFTQPWRSLFRKSVCKINVASSFPNSRRVKTEDRAQTKSDLHLKGVITPNVSWNLESFFMEAYYNETWIRVA